MSDAEPSPAPSSDFREPAGTHTIDSMHGALDPKATAHRWASLPQAPRRAEHDEARRGHMGALLGFAAALDPAPDPAEWAMRLLPMDLETLEFGASICRVLAEEPLLMSALTASWPKRVRLGQSKHGGGPAWAAADSLDRLVLRLAAQAARSTVRRDLVDATPRAEWLLRVLCERLDVATRMGAAIESPERRAAAIARLDPAQIRSADGRASRQVRFAQAMEALQTELNRQGTPSAGDYRGF